jgi:hypothetical protein
MPWALIISAAIMITEYVYNALNKPPPPPPERTVTIPLTTDGSPVPLLYGRIRVTQPILSFAGTPVARFDDASQKYQYMLDMLFVLGIPFEGSPSKIFAAWAGDVRFVPLAIAEHRGSELNSQDGNGGFEGGLPFYGHRHLPANIGIDQSVVSYWTTAGSVEFLNGNPSMQLVDPNDGTPKTQAGLMMTSTAWLGRPEIDDATRATEPWNYGVGHTDPFQVPGYRGYLSVWLWDFMSQSHWGVGETPQVSAYSYEVSSYPDGSALGLVNGVDCNPIDVIYDLLTGSFGKLGLPLSYIDSASFTAAGLTLAAEKHGFSRAFDSRMTAHDMLSEVLLQIDGVLYEDPMSASMKIKLIRGDYDTATLPVIDPDNCLELQNFAVGGWTDVVNRVVLTYTDRTADYKPATSTAFNQANAVGQDGHVNEMQVSMLGITTQELANAVAIRVLSAVSRPLMKCRAIVNRSMLRVAPGDVVKLSWPEANVSNIVMRVADMGKGTLENGTISLDLIQDYFYTHRGYPAVPPIDIRSLVTQF